MRKLQEIQRQEQCDYQTARVIQKMEALSDSSQSTGSVCHYKYGDGCRFIGDKAVCENPDDNCDWKKPNVRVEHDKKRN